MPESSASREALFPHESIASRDALFEKARTDYRVLLDAGWMRKPWFPASREVALRHGEFQEILRHDIARLESIVAGLRAGLREDGD